MSTVDRPTDRRRPRVPADRRRDRRARGPAGPRPEQRGTDDDLLLTSLAFSLERLARETAPSIADPAQRAELALAAARIRAVIDELGAREAPGRRSRPPPEEPEPDAETRRRAAPGAAVDGRSHPPDLRARAARDGRRARPVPGLRVRVHRVPREPQPARVAAGLQQRLATGTFGDPAAPVPSGPVALLQIPSIGMHQIVVQGSSPSDLKQGPGHMPGLRCPASSATR